MGGTEEQKRLTASWLNIIGAGTVSAGGVTQAVAVLIGDRTGSTALTGTAIAAGCLFTGFGIHLLARHVLAELPEADMIANRSASPGEDIGLSSPPKVAGRAPPETLMDEFSRGLALPEVAPQGLDSQAGSFLFCSLQKDVTMPATEVPDELPSFPSDTDVDAVLYEFRGDAREAIRALLHDLAVLAEDFDASVSHGFVRGGIPKLLLRKSA